jgi:hypothetical protein
MFVQPVEQHCRSDLKSVLEAQQSTYAGNVGQK